MNGASRSCPAPPRTGHPACWWPGAVSGLVGAHALLPGLHNVPLQAGARAGRCAGVGGLRSVCMTRDPEDDTVGQRRVTARGTRVPRAEWRGSGSAQRVCVPDRCVVCDCEVCVAGALAKHEAATRAAQRTPGSRATRHAPRPPHAPRGPSGLAVHRLPGRGVNRPDIPRRSSSSLGLLHDHSADLLVQCRPRCTPSS